MKFMSDAGGHNFPLALTRRRVSFPGFWRRHNDFKAAPIEVFHKQGKGSVTSIASGKYILDKASVQVQYLLSALLLNSTAVPG